jgi:hypothetical protein
MRAIIFTTIMLLFSVFCNAQTVEYIYDNAGNRTARRVIQMSSPETVKKALPDSDEPEEEQENPSVLEEILGKMQINIFPNPTKGILGIEIKDAGTTEEVALALYSGQGALMVERKIRQGHNTLDLSNYPPGWYILRLQTGDYRKEYKIIKE